MTADILGLIGTGPVTIGKAEKGGFARDARWCAPAVSPSTIQSPGLMETQLDPAATGERFPSCGLERV